ncbi:YeeE/YedE family protein [Methylomonas sp. MED-D]|uniref:YeeE/YedE family protein n=1 Tax=Methylomonas koyamae TaxID=702114 RepID=A0A177N4V5_9GAMM|nr:MULTISPECIES: hypothetical protein [Methylomonas]MDT4328890.1 YeeE/YedE family protein [Methylomonas sp. MV1]OAI12875.1 YeeE/YedE family protein [Methylomonas koyamae]OHX35169.1 YeeE/YedE family protein [Methylomonas sp. LWB]WGS87901.1 YeeE/YedE family protein [Methylomonas sp. UP202]
MNLSTILSSLAGGALIGLSAALLLYTHKHTAGISGIAAGLWQRDAGWRAWFLGGLLISAPLYRLGGGEIAMTLDHSPAWLAVAGLLVGYGTRLGSGCTSGHGVCGIARLAPRSLAATATFMLCAGATVYVVRHILAAGQSL